jgi:Domain of unknown function (DUF4395)
LDEEVRVARIRSVFSFPDPVNEVAARVVAGGVVVLSVAAIVLGAVADQGWPLVVLAAGFWARVLTGPTLSPLGQLSVRVIAPRLGAPRPVPGPPKRFAQAIGTAFSSTAVVLWFGFGLQTAALVVTGLLLAAALLEAAFAYCLGCKVFALLMGVGVIPAEACAECADVDLRPAERREPVAI